MEHGEFAARLYVGVRGEHMMAMENPLKDMEMSGEICSYRCSLIFRCFAVARSLVQAVYNRS